MLIKARVLDYINSTFKDINQALSSRPQGEICVKLNRLKGVSSNPSPVGSDNDVGSEGDDVPTSNKRRATSRQVKYHWPGKTESEAWRFSKSTCSAPISADHTSMYGGDASRSSQCCPI